MVAETADSPATIIVYSIAYHKQLELVQRRLIVVI